MLTLEEAKEMQGVEFTYIFEDGDTIPAYVKKFDPEVGLTCFTLATETRDGWKPDDDVEKDGTFCVMGYPAGDEDNLQECLEILDGIKENGSHTTDNQGNFFIGCVFS